MLSNNGDKPIGTKPGAGILRRQPATVTKAATTVKKKPPAARKPPRA
jgi:hypothetical protein